MGRWEILTWGQYRDQVLQAARGLMNLGIEPGDGMAILGDNCPGWLLSHFAAIAAGGIPAGIYTNNTPEQCTLIADHCDAVVAFIENEELLESFLDSRARLSHLRVIVLMDGDHPDPGVISWQDLLDQGSQVAAASLRQRLDAVDPHGVCELIYTSGTTGRPKGVMLTHHNVIWTADRLTSAYDIGPADSLISYLPLSHIAEQIFSLYAPVFTGACVWFAESLDKVGENLREVRPHFFFAVPRVWEKIHMRITSAAARSSARERRIAAWAQHKGLEGGYAEQQGRSKALLYGLADKLVLNKVRQRLGLMDGTELKIEAAGEICMRGPHISPGYFKDPAATRETFDGQGWLHSGDIGEIDDQGFLSITDRKKELIITSGGKNVGPQAIENELRRIEVVGQAVVIGDRQKYLAALLTLDPEALPRVAARVGSPARDLSAAAACPVLRSHLESQVEEVNAALARFKTIKRFTILPVELSVRGGEMTPTMKLKRRFVNEKYAKEIEELYL
jgi:long-subunit acyl-CoA synthetase (AMP-forming)